MGVGLIFIFSSISEAQISITSPSSLSGAAGTSVTYQIVANNSPTSFSQTGLPSKMRLDSSTGIISGTLPSSLGTTVVTITATGPYGTATSTLSLISTDSITVTTESEGTTPSLLGYNLGHFMTSGDAADWFRYSGVKGARVFISATDLQSSTSPGRSKVTSLSTFNSNVMAARSAGTASSAYIKWSDYNYNIESTSGSNDINYKNAFTALTGLGVDILANITCSPGTFPLTSATDYAGWWEIWQHYYAQAYLLSRDYGIRRFSMFNEPNNWNSISTNRLDGVDDWVLRLRICSDAIQAGVADMNTANGRNVVPQIYAPNTANGEGKYNTSTETWGHDAVVNRHLKLDGTMSSSWLLMNFYNYQKYSMYTDDTGSLTGYIQDIDALAGYIAADMPGETPFPLVLSEFNVRTASNYDGTSNNQDSPEDFSALGANCIALTRRSVNQLFLFKFGQTEDTTSPYGVAKNGAHYVDNINSDCNYGGSTKAAEVYRLFNKAAQGGRSRFLANTSSGAAMSSSSGGSGLWRLVTQDPGTGNYYVYLANKKTSGITFSLNVAAWSIADGTPVVVEEVSSTCSGGVSQIVNVQSGQAYLGTIPAQSVWLVTVPNQSATLASITATEDTQVGDGTNSGNIGGALTSIQVRADGTKDGRKAVLVKIPTPSASSSNLKSVLLDLGVAASSSSTSVQAHVYGLTTDSWTEGSASWSNLGAVLKQGTSVGNQIAQNVALNTGTAPSAKMLGQIWVNSTIPTRRMLDVTDFVKSRTGGYASFLVVQEHRWNYSADLTNVRTTGDIQSAGLVITSKEKTGAGARLLAVQTGSASTAPVILNQPQDQSLNLGDTISLSVTTDGSTSVAYQWKKDGVAIAGASGPVLVITSIGLTDAGSYTCSVSNLYGTSTSATATVAINTAPVVVKGLKNNTVYVDDTVTLSATFLGAPVPTYSWKKDGVTIPGATESSYTFIPVSITGSGTYTVTAINTYGSISSSATVIVNASPTSFKNISNANFTYTQNFDGLEKSGTNGIRTTIYSPWTDGGINKDASCEGWYVATDTSLSGYRTLNCSSSSNATCPPPESQSGVLSMGAASGTTERSLGGIPWVGNKIYMGLRLRNATGKVLHGCTVAFALEQMTATTLAKSDTLLNLAIQVNAASLKSGTWMSVTNFSPPTNASAYININGSGSSYSQSPSTNAVPGARSIKNITLNNLNVGQDQDLWIRWTFASTSSEPLAMGIDDVTINNLVLVDQTFANVMGGVSPTSDSDSDGVMALLEYAFGGSANRNDLDRMPVSSFSNNELSLTYLARTDDTSLSILPEVNTDLTSNSGWVSSATPNSGITVTNLGTVDISGTTFERRKATVGVDSSGAKFMRIKTILNQ
jgi:hypothetical protein